MKLKYTLGVLLLCIAPIIFSGVPPIYASTSDSEISILEVSQHGVNIWVTIDYDFSIAPARGETKSLVVLTLLSLPSDSADNEVTGSLLFVRAPLGDYYFFWMLGDPFTENDMWLSGSINEHFQTDQNQLCLIFIEYPEMENPDLEIVVFAQLLEIGNTDLNNSDLFSIVYEFLPYLESIEMLPIVTTTTTTTTTTTKAKGFPGFLLPINIGVLILIGLKYKERE